MAGEGNRFKSYESKLPKPLIQVHDKSMIERVIDNLGSNNNYIFIIQKKHTISNSLDVFLKKLLPDCKVIITEHVTEGPACTALLAEEFITSDPLIIINCDQIIKDFSIDELILFSQKEDLSGILGAFISTSEKNSYMKLNSNGEVVEIKEKLVISNIATNGLHFWKNGTDFIHSAKEMISCNERYNNEFYIAPTYNYLIKKGKKVLPFFYNFHYPIGTPEDLKYYINKYGNT